MGRGSTNLIRLPTVLIDFSLQNCQQFQVLNSSVKTVTYQHSVQAYALSRLYVADTILEEKLKKQQWKGMSTIKKHLIWKLTNIGDQLSYCSLGVKVGNLKSSFDGIF